MISNPSSYAVSFTGTENVQAAQKYITGLDARRIAKLPEHRSGILFF